MSLDRYGATYSSISYSQGNFTRMFVTGRLFYQQSTMYIGDDLAPYSFISNRATACEITPSSRKKRMRMLNVSIKRN